MSAPLKPEPTQPKAQTFATMQKQGEARPASPSYQTMASPMPVVKAAPQPTAPQAPNIGQTMYQQFTQAPGPSQFTPPQPTMTPGTNPYKPQPTAMQGQLSQQMMAMLGNPTGFSNDVAMSAFEQMRGRIDEDAKLAREGATTDYARRGLYHSTPLMSKYGDIGVQADRAKNDAAVSITNEMAKTRGADLARMLGLAMGYDQQSFGQNLAYDQFGASQDAQKFGQALDTFGANQAAQGQNFSQRDQMLQRLLGFGQQSFDNQMATSRFNRESDLAEQEMMLRMLGLT